MTAKTFVDLEDKEFMTEVNELGDKIHPLLAGRPPDVQAGLLADCVARWVAGHYHHEGEKESKLLREELIIGFAEYVGLLVEVLVKKGREAEAELDAALPRLH